MSKFFCLGIFVVLKFEFLDQISNKNLEYIQNFKGMTGFGTARRETTKIRDTAHPEYDPESSIDSTTIPSQMGSNKYASQKGMTGFGQPRWEVLDPSISWQNRKSQGMVRLQSGTNRLVIGVNCNL